MACWAPSASSSSMPNRGAKLPGRGGRLPARSLSSAKPAKGSNSSTGSDNWLSICAFSAAWLVPSPAKTICSTPRPPNWFCAAAIVRRISPNSHRACCSASSCAPTRTVRMKTTFWPTSTVKSASSLSCSIISRQRESRPRRIKSDAAATGRSTSRLGTRAALSHVWRICSTSSGEIAAASTLIEPSLVPGNGMKSRGQSSPKVANCRTACRRTMSGNSSAGAGGTDNSRSSILVRPTATSVSARPTRYRSSAPAKRLPTCASASAAVAPSAREPRSMENARSMTTLRAPRRASTTRASRLSHSSASKRAIDLLSWCSFSWCRLRPPRCAPGFRPLPPIAQFHNRGVLLLTPQIASGVRSRVKTAPSNRPPGSPGSTPDPGGSYLSTILRGASRR